MSTQMKDEDRYLEIGNRPWGNYYVLEDYPDFKVKRLVVKPGARLSLQSHNHRAEHWTVVAGIGTLEVHIGPEAEWIKEYKPNQYCHIPKKAKHRITNNGTEDLVIIEVQCGDYTGEDDIIRYQDDYGRS